MVHISLGSGFSSCYNNALLPRTFLVKVVIPRIFAPAVGTWLTKRLWPPGQSAAEIAAELERLHPESTPLHHNQLDYLAREVDVHHCLRRQDPAHEAQHRSADGAAIVGRKYRGNFEKAVKLYVQDWSRM